MDDNQTDREDVDPVTSKTYFHHARAQVNNAIDTSSELIQQIPRDNQSRVCADTEDLQLMVRNPMNVSDKVNSL